MLPITWVFNTLGLRYNTLLYKSQALLYEVLGAPTDSFFYPSSFFFTLRLRLYIIFKLYLLFILALQFLLYLKVVFLFILRLPEQIASSCSSTCNTCNTAGCARYDASRIDASLEDVVSSSQAPPSIHSHWIGCWVVPLRLGSPRRALTLILWASASFSFILLFISSFV